VLLWRHIDGRIEPMPFGRSGLRGGGMMDEIKRLGIKISI
jgi:hypothetical protein